MLLEACTWRSFSIGGNASPFDLEKPMKPSATPGREVADLEAIGSADSLFNYSLADIPVLMNNPADLRAPLGSALALQWFQGRHGFNERRWDSLS
ncbi:hypothetical protein SAMN02927914_04744 [Mesorhizobium qingshengii]|uniref:Uncharacterized protein n=1 Tax=Mesorhizobium qingshengii TaxID=1165689 RepID=A0A1G5ZDE4_9HYPH|nr:hypothetical protein SAMN02927914_04744 [Mesorhizobium qingshengii]